MSKKQPGNSGQQSEELLDREIANALADRAPRKSPASILLVIAEGDFRNRIIETIELAGHHCICLGRLDTALSSITGGRYDLMIVEPDLPGGDSLELSRHVQKESPATKVLFTTRNGSEMNPIEAMRAGVFDIISEQASPDILTDRIEVALAKTRIERERNEHIVVLKKICKELNIARHEISEQVDVLCKDLVNAYQDMAEQMDEVAMSSEFKTLLKQELDVEELLRTALQYLLTKTGPTNAAVFLPDSDQNYGLGAYVNYDCPRESITVLLDHLCYSICPQMALENEIITFNDTKEFCDWIDTDSEFISDAQVIAFSCMHKEECLAVVVLFRNKADRFTDELAGTLETLRSIFAEQLSNIIKIHHRAKPSWPDEAVDGGLDFEGDDYGFGFEGGLAA